MLSIAPSCRTDGGLGVFIGSPQTKCIYVVSSVDGEQERMIKVAGGWRAHITQSYVLLIGGWWWWKASVILFFVSERSQEAANNIYYDFIKSAW